MIDHKTLNENPIICFEQLLADDSPLQYLYGPYLIINNYLSEYKLNWRKNPILKAFKDIAHLIRMIKAELKVSDLKQFLIDYITENSKYSSEYWQADVCVKEYQKIMQGLKSYQYEAKLLESAMISYAPIVDYSGMTKMPMMTTEHQDGVKVFLDNLIHTPEKYVSTDILDEYLKDNIFSIVNYAGINLCLVPFTDVDFFKLYSYREYHDELYTTCSYYITSYLINKMNTDHASELLTSLRSIDQANKNIAEEKFNTEAMINILSNISLEASTDISEHMEYEADREVERIMDIAHVDDEESANLEKNYNIYDLTDYLYTSRRYMHNKYTNSLFLSSNREFQDCSYLKDDVLVAEIDNEYLATPVIDLADDYKTKLIRLDKNGVISIIPL